MTNPKAIELLADILGETSTPEENPPVAPPCSDPRLPGYQVHGVLAGSYKGRQFDSSEIFLTHYAKDWVPLCKAVKANSLVDPYDDDGQVLPTCPSCLAKARKLMKKPV